jgi:hypothetical protein
VYYIVIAITQTTLKRNKMTSKSIVNYKSFNAAIEQNAETDHLYILKDDKEWIKNTAAEYRVRMVTVIPALIRHAETSDKVFKRLITLLRFQDNILANGGFLPEILVTEIHAILDMYSDVQ